MSPELVQKVKVFLTALPTYLAVVTAVLTALAQHIVPLLPESVAVQVSAWIVLALGWITAIVTTIRRLTPVEPWERGMLPRYPEALSGAGLDNNNDQGSSTIGTVMATLLAVFMMFFALILIS